MRTETTTRTLYNFDELTEQAQGKALDALYYTNVDFDWWDSIYDDAKCVGLKITGFDTGRGSSCDIEFTEDACHTAHAIVENHGEHCETHKDATNFLAERDGIVNSAEKDENGDFVDEIALDDKLNEVEAEFLRTLSEDYRIMLCKEYEYLTTEEAIKEAISANEYEFTEDGKLA
jgi:hypothetical protein